MRQVVATNRRRVTIGPRLESRAGDWDYHTVEVKLPRVDTPLTGWLVVHGVYGEVVVILTAAPETVTYTGLRLAARDAVRALWGNATIRWTVGKYVPPWREARYQVDAETTYLGVGRLSLV